MLHFDLPVIDATVPLASAFAAVMSRDVSGVVVRHGGKYRLLHLDELRLAHDQDKSVAGDVEGVQVGAGGSAAATASQKWLEDTGYRFLFVTETTEVASLISVHEPFANRYLAAPTVVKCLNPNTPHRYPPNNRSAGQVTCTFDSYPLA